MNIKRLFCLLMLSGVIYASNSFAQENKWVLFIKDTDKLQYYYDSLTLKQTGNYIEVMYRVDNYLPDVERWTGLVRLYCRTNETLILKHVIYYKDHTKTTDDYPKGKSRQPITPGSMLDFLQKTLCN